MEVVDGADSMDMSLSETVNRTAWCTAVHGVTKSWTQLSKCTTMRWSSSPLYSGSSKSIDPSHGLLLQVQKI